METGSEDTDFRKEQRRQRRERRISWIDLRGSDPARLPVARRARRGIRPVSSASFVVQIVPPFPPLASLLRL